MKKLFIKIEKELKEFFETEEKGNISSDINNLYYKMTNSYPEIPDIKYVLEELQSYTNKLLISQNEKNKFYILALGKINVLKNKAEQAGAI